MLSKIMLSKIMLITLGVFLISLAGAVSIISGESTTIVLPEQYEYYSVIGNSTELDLNIFQDEFNVTITLGKYAKEDKFEIIFFNKEKEIINHYYGGGGSSSSSSNNEKEYIEVPNYIDRVVYKENKTKTDELTNTLIKTEKKLTKGIFINNILNMIAGILFIVTISLVLYVLNLKREKKTLPSENSDGKKK